MATSRRDLLMHLAAAGGWAVALGASKALGMDLTGGPPAAIRLDLPRDLGKGRKVLILGAGIAGLVSALELTKAGYDVQVLEARERVGGRSWTLRGGDKVDFVDGRSQTVGFDKGVYMNAGPGRLPGWHRNILTYCKELGVELQPMVNANHSALLLPGDKTQAAIPLRRVQADARGMIAELLAKSIKRGALDQDVTVADRRMLTAFLGAWGAIRPDGTYEGSERAGFKTWPAGGDTPPTALDPLPMKDLINFQTWEALTFEELVEFQPSMMQPVGGMDAIPKAFAARLKGKIRHGAEVISIDNLDGGVEVTWKDLKTGKVTVATAEQAIVALPLTVLAKIKTNLPSDITAAIARTRYDASVKTGWQAPRFWEEQGIYGGISYTSDLINHVWYPSFGFHKPQGMLLGAYNFGPQAEQYAAMSLEQQFAYSRATIERMHPGHGADLGHPVSIIWKDIPFNLGPWVDWETGGSDYRLLNQPIGRVHLAGEHLSFMTSWQEGAAVSALRVVERLAGMAKAA
jgi:monoamine oxidase